MKFKLFKLKTYGDIQKWHKWFAWYPVKINQHWVWLEYVEQRCEVFSYSLGGMIEHSTYWHYRENKNTDTKDKASRMSAQFENDTRKERGEG